MSFETRLWFEKVESVNRKQLDLLTKDIDNIIAMSPIPYNSQIDQKPLPAGEDGEPFPICDRLIEVKFDGFSEEILAHRTYDVWEYYGCENGYRKNSSILTRRITPEMIENKDWGQNDFSRRNPLL